MVFGFPIFRDESSIFEEVECKGLEAVIGVRERSEDTDEWTLA
jgi:hypothetical protein